MSHRILNEETTSIRSANFSAVMRAVPGLRVLELFSAGGKNFGSKQAPRVRWVVELFCV